MKICVVCPNFDKESVRKQPWRYVYELLIRLLKLDIQVVLITNQVQRETINGVTVHYVEKLRPLFLCNNAPLSQILYDEKADVILWVVGPSSFFYLSWLKKCKSHNILLLTGPFYSLQDILVKLGPGNAIRFLPHIWANLVGTLVPKVLVRALLNAPYIYGVFVLSKKNKSILENNGVHRGKIFFIPPGIDDLNHIQVFNKEKVREIRKNLSIAPKDFVILFMGPATKLRGADILVESVRLIHKRIPALKVIILARRLADPSAEKGERQLELLIAKLGLKHVVKVIKGVLPRGEVKKFIVASDVVALPFRFVQSDVPISVLEAVVLGKPLISTDIDGIPEWINEGNGMILKSARPVELAKALVMFYLSQSYPARKATFKNDYQLLTWNDIALKVAEVTKSVAT